MLVFIRKYYLSSNGKWVHYRYFRIVVEIEFPRASNRATNLTPMFCMTCILQCHMLLIMLRYFWVTSNAERMKGKCEEILRNYVNSTRHTGYRALVIWKFRENGKWMVRSRVSSPPKPIGWKFFKNMRKFTKMTCSPPLDMHLNTKA